MSEFTLPHFGQINLTSLDEYYEVVIEFNGNPVQIDLNFTNKTIDRPTMEIVKKFIEDIDTYDKLNKIYIDNDYNDEEGETVKLYLEHHLEEIDREELSKLIDFDNENIEPEKQLLNTMHLVRLGIYPYDEKDFAIFDYTIGRDLTNYLVVVKTDKEGQLEYIAMES
jgi:hypothetical protein